MFQTYEKEYNQDGTEKHIFQDGARFHVVHWDSHGAHCSEPNCEINRREVESGKDNV